MTDRYYRWPGNQMDVQEKISHLRDRARVLGDAATTLREGSPYNLYNETGISTLASLYASFAECLALLAIQLPYKKGDRVRLLKTPRCGGGWASSKHFLVEGAIGTVQVVEVDYLMRDWSVLVSFDDESWIAPADFPPQHRKGDVVPTPPEQRHVYDFAPSYIERLRDTELESTEVARQRSNEEALS